jgi:hypothetical protein
MIKRVLVFFIALLIGFGGYSQNKISGVIFDEQTGKVVQDAFIMKKNGSGVVSDLQGQFSIDLAKMPAILVVSHVSYGQSEIELTEWPDGMLIIRIQRMISNLQEVQVTADRMRILTEKDDFSLQDFAIDSTNIWMLGYINNRPKFGRLWLANLYGDTLRSIPISKAENLYRDVFGNVHLMYEDSVYQLYGSPDTIVIYPGFSRQDFRRIFNPIKGYFAGKLIYQTYLPFQEGLHTYYYSQTDSLPKLLTCIRDTTGEILQEDEYIYGRCASVMASLMGAAGCGGLKIYQELSWRRDNAKNIFYRRLEVPIISAKKNLYILNYYKDSLLSYDASGAYLDSRLISFHKNLEIFKGIRYGNLTYSYDPISDRVYILERKERGWVLSMLNTESGEIQKTIPLPDFPGMTGITISNNAVYFLYPEKHYPFYSRLYRYQL